ncbi:17423_t:CDS:2 [Cetraspora pellucida]|uniref:17423_t:CDS:1 n=1 Tax=Cetraspora pellucida TaxID=1433469 RepID=A0ACA9KIW5_9GLOM|nr:17423_t:CDS:2 [Cetraspora pellucida]
MLNPLKFIRHKVQEKKLYELAKRCGRDPKDLPTMFQNPYIVTLVFDYLKEKDSEEMPALLFDWNDAGFNDTAVPNCRNGITGQTKASIIANLLANGATNYRNQDILFIFPNGLTIGDWYWNLVTNLPWYEIIMCFRFSEITYPLSFLKGRSTKMVFPISATTFYG